MNKRLIVFLIFCVVILDGVAGTLFFFAQKRQAPAADTRPLGVKKVLDETVVSPIASLDKNSVWYFNKDGRLFKASADGSNLSEFALPSWPGSQTLRRILWPSAGSDFIAVGNDGSKNYYDSAAKTFIKLAPNIQYLDWLPDNKRIIYIWRSDDAKTQQLVISNSDGSGYRFIANVFWPDLVVKASPDGKSALLYRGSVQAVNKIYSVDLVSGQITTMIDSGKNTAAMWLPNSDKFLFAQDNGTALPKVMIYDLNKKTASDLKINSSLDRIGLDSTGLAYAAIAKTDNTGDEIIQIDLKSLKITNYFTPSEQIQVKNLFLVGSTVYYIDTRDSKLYSISK